MREDNPRCVCGHLINKSHTYDMKKIMKGKPYDTIIGKCNFCKCKEVCIE